jgi:hypothetical protein
VAHQFITSDNNSVTIDNDGITSDGLFSQFVNLFKMNGCEINRKNLGKSKCNKLPSLPKCMIETSSDFFLAPADYATPAALKLALQNAIKAGKATRIYLWPKFSSVEPLSQETTYEDNPLTLVPVIAGQYRWRFGVSKNLCMHRAMFSHNAINEGRMFLFDVKNQLFGTEDSDGNVRGFSIAMLNVEKLQLSDGTNSTKSPIYLALGDNEEIDDAGVVLDASVVNQLEPLTDVDITVLDAAADAIVFEVKNACDGTAIAGLIAADIVIYALNGIDTQAKGALTPDPVIQGRYSIAQGAADPFESGSITLVAAEDLSITAYEHPEPTDFVIA